MTGRYALTASPEIVRGTFGYVDKPDFPPRYNIAPTQPIAIVRRDAGSPDPDVRRFHLVRWGLVPGFVKDFSAFRPFVNARCEDLIEKASFRNAVRRRRCLIPADAYYLWQQRGREPSQPYLLRRCDAAPFGLAGLMETWAGGDGSEIDTACIITRPARGAAAAVHGRMPAIIAPPGFDAWLDPDERRTEEARRLLQAETDLQFVALPIGPAINKPGYDDAGVQHPTDEPLPTRYASFGADDQGTLF